MEYIDLHTHSDFSDGAISPTGVIRKAKDAGLTTIALTDHDTINGLDEAENTALKEKIDFIRGVEISAYNDRFSNIHIVGLFLEDPNPIRSIQREIETRKSPYISDVCDCLSKKIDRDFSFETIKAKLKGSVSLGTLSLLLAQERIYPSYVSAFSMLKDMKKTGELPNEPQFRVPILQAIEQIHLAGGIAVLAHPCRLDKKVATFSGIKPFIDPIIDRGIDAIEAFYPNQDCNYTKEVLDYANKKDILVSGGSDFHGQKAEALIGKYPDGSYIMENSRLRCLQNRALYYKQKLNIQRQIHEKQR